jgi:hypothetical protein
MSRPCEALLSGLSGGAQNAGYGGQGGVVLPGADHVGLQLFLGVDQVEAGVGEQGDGVGFGVAQATEYEELGAEGDHRSEAVDDSCECYVNSGFTEGEQRERDAVQKERKYKEMTPRCPIMGKRCPGDLRENDQRDGTKHESAKGYVDRRERPKSQPDKPERAAPDCS